MKTLILSFLALSYFSVSAAIRVEEPANESPPKIKLVVRDGSDKEIDVIGGIRGTGLTQLRVYAVPDGNSESAQTSGYEIRGMEVIVVRGTSRVSTLVFKTGIADVTVLRSQMREGDRIVINVKSVIRKVGDREERVDLPVRTINIAVR